MNSSQSPHEPVDPFRTGEHQPGEDPSTNLEPYEHRVQHSLTDESDGGDAHEEDSSKAEGDGAAGSNEGSADQAEESETSRARSDVDGPAELSPGQDSEINYPDAARQSTFEAAADQALIIKGRQRAQYAEGVGTDREKRKAKSPFRLRKATWMYSLKRTLTEFGRDGCSDYAAALTYYAVLSIFPALIAFVSLISLVGERERTEQFILDTASQLVDDNFVSSIEGVIGQVSSASGAGLGLAIGILAALWTASNYVNAFSRAMNRIFEIDEGRSAIRLRPVIYAVTVALVLLVAVSVVMLVVSGPVAEALVTTLGLGDTALTVWNYATYPILLVVAATCIGLLYYATPNIRQPGAKWISAGALIAIVVMVLATAGVGFYISNFANYQATYGALAGVIIFLFWIYIMNMVLLFGAEFDAELERGRQLQAGIEAERTIMLAPRRLDAAEKRHTKYEKVVAGGQALRFSEGETSSPEDLWRR
jgi:membrane protein